MIAVYPSGGCQFDRSDKAVRLLAPGLKFSPTIIVKLRRICKQ